MTSAVIICIVIAIIVVEDLPMAILWNKGYITILQNPLTDKKLFQIIASLVYCMIKQIKYVILPLIFNNFDKICNFISYYYFFIMFEFIAVPWKPSPSIFWAYSSGNVGILRRYRQKFSNIVMPFCLTITALIMNTNNWKGK